MASAAQLAAALGGRRQPTPMAASVVPRSQYLAQALQSLQTTQKNPQSWGELAADLGAVALTEHGRKGAEKKEKAASDATASARNASLLKALDSYGQPAALAAPEAQPIAPVEPQVTPPAPPLSAPATSPVAAAPGLSPGDRDALANAVYGEARGEPAAGQQAVASVILNRANQSGRPVSDIVSQPHQFSGFDPSRQPDPRQLAAVMGNIGGLADGSMPPTTQADHFFAPQGMPGGQPPSWAQGQPQETIGHQQFLKLGFGGGQQPQAQPVSQPMAPPASQPEPPPQAAPPAPEAAQPPPPAMAPTQGPDPRQQQISVIRSLLSDPSTAELGQQLALSLFSEQAASKDKGFEFSTLTQQGQVVRLDPRTGKAEVAYQGPKDERGAEYGLNPIPIEIGGQVHLFQPSKSGGMREIPMPEGGRFSKSLTMVDRGVDRVGIDPLTGQPITDAISKNVGAAQQQQAAGQIAGETQATAQAGLPAALASGEQSLGVIDQILKSPEMNSRTGLIGALPAFPGSPGVAFDNMVNQVKGQAFLTAFTSLKGAGAITETEGAKATQAIARLDRRQSPEDFRTALTDLAQVIKLGMERARAKAAGGMAPQGAPAPQAGAGDADLLARYGIK